MTEKTSVTWLREICTRFKGNETYNYTEIPFPGASRDPFFECRISLKFKGMDYEEVGNGRTKREAKRNSAQIMLNAMEVFAQDELKVMSYKSENVDYDSKNKTDVDWNNPVSQLQELCIKIRRQQPIYKIESEFGSPHDREYRISCHVGDEFVQIATGKSKKTAKRDAAKKMEVFLNSLEVQIVRNTSFYEDDDKIIEAIRASKTNTGKKSKGMSNAMCSSFKILSCQDQYKLVPGPELDKLKFDETFIPVNPILFLQELGKEQKFCIDYTEIEDKSTDDKYQCLVQLSTEPIAVLMGTGMTSQEAKKESAMDAINFIRRVMIKKH